MLIPGVGAMKSLYSRHNLQPQPLVSTLEPTRLVSVLSSWNLATCGVTSSEILLWHVPLHPNVEPKVLQGRERKSEGILSQPQIA
jgi:hypothetical protein